MKDNEEIYSIKFSTGRTCTVLVRYHDDRIPTFAGSLPQNLTTHEKAEYRRWRVELATDVQKKLPPAVQHALAIEVLTRMLNGKR